MRTVEVNLYQFDELDDKAKQRAMDWYREASAHDVWWDSSYDDFVECGKRLGIKFGEKDGNNPAIYFTGFWSQGDGACFEGTWTYNPDAIKQITEYAPKDADLQKIAQRLEDAQNAWGSKLSARVTQRGNYYHSMSTDIEVRDGAGEGYEDISPDVTVEVMSALRAFMNWMYERLERENEYLNSDETVAYNIRANEYEFYSDGRRACEV